MPKNLLRVVCLKLFSAGTIFGSSRIPKFDYLTQPSAIYSRFFEFGFVFFYFQSSWKQKRKGEDGDGASLGLKEVKSTYKDVDDYISTFEPLLLEEIKAQIIQRNDDEEGIWLPNALGSVGKLLKRELRLEILYFYVFCML